MLKLFFTYLFICFSLLYAFGQDEHLHEGCYTDQVMQLIQEKNPQIRAEYQVFKKKHQIEANDISASKRSVITIPIIVHVIHSGENVGFGSNISMARITEQIDILNQDYGFTNADRQHIPDDFSSDVGKTNIQFCLIQKTPAGDPHSGVNRILYNNIPDIEYIEEVIKPNTQWNPVKFMNIWVVQLPSQGILGYSYLPIPSILHTDKDGIVIDTDKFGIVGSQIKGRTATHEVGHYLGLHHPWGEVESCTSDDGISDTPNCRGPYFGCPTHPQVSCGSLDMSMNFMDYVDDPCMYMFTKGQGALMYQVLGDERLALSNGAEYICNFPVTSSEDVELDERPQVYPNPSDGQIVIENLTGFENETVLMQLYTLSGKKVFEQKQEFNENEQIINMNFSSFRSGTFVLKMTSKNAHFTEKIVIITGG